MNVPTYSAGTLIGHYSASERRNGKTVANVTENQNLLLLAVATLKVDSPFILLDGHFCVRDPLGKIQKIPADTYTSLSVKAVIVLREETSVIEANLYSRDGVRHSQQEISALQNAELDYAGEITSKMNIPLKVLGNSNLAEAIFFIRNAMVSLCEL
jgi:adenylate kinase